MTDFTSVVEKALPHLIRFGLRLAGALFGLWVTLRAAGWLQNRLTDGLRARKFDETLSLFFGNMARWLLVAAAVLACLSVFGIETTSFAALIGAAGLAVGLAFQGTLGNFAAGVMLLVFRPFKVGDVISAGGHTGAVAAIGLFSTALDTVDNRRIIFPNTAVANGTIENVTFNAHRRVDIDVAIDPGVMPDTARAALDKAAAATLGRDPALGHQVFLMKATGASTDWQVRVWCTTGDYFTVWEATIRSIKMTLAEAGIRAPAPALNVTVAGELKR